MSQVLVRNIATEVVDLLKDRANRNGRSLESELRCILEEATGSGERRRFLEDVRAFRAGLGNRPFTDSTDIIRDARDTRCSV